MLAADRDCARRHQDDLLAALAAARHIGAERSEPGAVDFPVLLDQQRRADLDDEPLRRGERGGGLLHRHGVHHASTNASSRAASIAAQSAPTTSGTPAPLTPESGSTVAPRPAARASARHLRVTSAGSIASILLSPTTSGLPARPWP